MQNNKLKEAMEYLELGFHIIRRSSQIFTDFSILEWGISDVFFEKEDTEILLELLKKVEKVNSPRIKHLNEKGTFYYKLKGTKSCYE